MHPLDNPAWNALTSRHAGFAEQVGGVVRYRADRSFFAGAAEYGDHWADVERLVGETGPLVLFGTDATGAPAALTTDVLMICQMLLDDAASLRASGRGTAPPLVELGEADWPEMQALVELTRPGPFFARTPELGEFLGVRREGRLVAMAGTRMTMPGFTEISAVATHPDARGEGLGEVLTHAVARRILDRGDLPFLHTDPANALAIRLYERLGLRTRRIIPVTITYDEARGERPRQAPRTPR